MRENYMNAQKREGWRGARERKYCTIRHVKKKFNGSVRKHEGKVSKKTGQEEQKE